MAKTTSKKTKPVRKTAAKSPAKKTVKKVKKAAPAKPAKKAAKPVKAAPEKTKAEKPDEAFLIAQAVVKGILEKKGENIVCLDLRKLENAVTDYYIICEANSNIQVEAIADSVEDTVKKELGQRPYRSEGWENALWILIDYINVVVHVFERETRYFYNLESLWADGEQVKFDGK